MFWKNVNIIKKKLKSLTAKLIILYSLSMISMLLIVCIFLYPTFSNTSKCISVEFFEKTIIAILSGSICSVILGFIIARNGLRRLSEFSEKMEKISVNSLHERINPSDWPEELKTLGNNFNAMLDRVQGAFIQLSQFSSDIAHELRTPVNNLRWLTELALTQKKSVTEYRQVLESNIEEYQHLATLIENLLFLARSDHGQLTLHKEKQHARNEVIKLIDYFQALADENNIKITCEGDAEIFVEPILFKRVINNLLSNALRYTHKNGSIAIKITSQNHLVHISIQDTGIGIEEKHLPNLFNRFYRVDTSRSTLSGGLGLGLAIVKSIIDLHHGKISIESQINSGTTVHLQLANC